MKNLTFCITHSPLWDGLAALLTKHINARIEMGNIDISLEDFIAQKLDKISGELGFSIDPGHYFNVEIVRVLGKNPLTAVELAQVNDTGGRPEIQRTLIRLEIRE